MDTSYTAFAEAPGMPELLSVHDLAVKFPVRTGFLEGLRGVDKGTVRAVDGVDLAVGQGEILALVGESGCGKTTTGRAILRLVDPRRVSGTVRFDDRDVYSLGRRDLAAFRKSAQVIFQDPYQSLNPKDCVREIVAEPLRVHHIAAGSELLDRCIEALEAAGLRPARSFLDRYPHELSGGQRQRLAIAASLVLSPRFIVADEPVSMLDVSVRAGIVRLLARLRDERGLAFLFITHDLALAWLIADRIAIMYLGRIVETGPASLVLDRPAHPYTKALVDVMPRYNGRRRTGKRRILPGEPPNPAAIPSGCRFRPRCPLAQDICSAEEPTLVDLGDGRSAACHFARNG
jgi:peptide/nickel transport system ATP-binding protein